MPYALRAQSSPPLNEVEKRTILRQLFELEAARTQILTYETFIARDKDADKREADNWQRSLDLERQATALAQKERDLAQEKADLYKALLDAKKPKAGFACTLKRIFTLGIARCGG